MQSQQKRVKWSRGETAEALQERTDTGITSASSASMINCIPDIYGNISRRPALKLISRKNDTIVPFFRISHTMDQILFDRPVVFTMSIDESSYIVFIAWSGRLTSSASGAITGFLVTDNIIQKRITITTTGVGYISISDLKPVSVAQYNNYMIVTNLYTGVLSSVTTARVAAIFRLTSDNNITVEKFTFSAPWAQPNGTTNVEVSLIGSSNTLSVRASTATPWVFTDNNGGAVSGTAIELGITTTNIQEVENSIPLGSIVTFPANGGYMRVEGYFTNINPFPDVTFDGILNNNATVPTTGSYCRIYNNNQLQYWKNNVLQSTYKPPFNSSERWVRYVVKNSGSSSGYSGVSWKNDNTFQAWTLVVQSNSTESTWMYGELLTPIADNEAIDTRIVVEKGFISLENSQPGIVEFYNQRLYAASFYSAYTTPKKIPGYAVGSQIAKYNDFKNEYNKENEAVTIDISSKYQEEILAMIDYNGLKIFTDSAEYQYSTDSGVQKQSENGILFGTKPIVVGGVCLYADKTAKHIRAMQYEFQSDIYQSSAIDQFTRNDLITNSMDLSTFIDKEHYSGHFVFAYQHRNTDHSFAVCNFVPNNQAMIWSRWKTPVQLRNGNEYQTVIGTISVQNKVWFVVCFSTKNTQPNILYRTGISLAELDYESNLDFETTPIQDEVDPDDWRYYITKTEERALYAWANPDETEGFVYTKKKIPQRNDDVYNYLNQKISSVDSYDPNTNTITYNFGLRTATRSQANDYTPAVLFPQGTVSVYDGNEYKFDTTVDANGKLAVSLTGLTNPKVGYQIHSEIESHPIDINGKTGAIKKRIAKAKLTVRDTNNGAVTINSKYGYMSPDGKLINFYNVTGMKDIVTYKITNNNGAKFTIESLVLDLEYGTLD